MPPIIAFATDTTIFGDPKEVTVFVLPYLLPVTL
jgi:hypothetical protein